jgi:hypothetical protein
MKPFVVARHLSLLVCLAALLLFLGAAAHAAGGKWNFTHDPRDHPELTYQENGKTVFFLGVGRAIALWIAYPGPPQPDKDEETIEIRTAQDVFVMKGELTRNLEPTDLDYLKACRAAESDARTRARRSSRRSPW